MIPIVLKTHEGREVMLGFGEMKDGRVEIISLERIMLRVVCDTLDKRTAEESARQMPTCDRECGAVMHMTGGRHRTDCAAYVPDDFFKTDFQR